MFKQAVSISALRKADKALPVLRAGFDVKNPTAALFGAKTQINVFRKPKSHFTAMADTKATKGIIAPNIVGNIMAKGDVVKHFKEVMPGFKVKSMNPVNREATNRIARLHEGMELRVGKKLKNKAPKMFHGHLSPEVVLRESNIMATLPKELKQTRQTFVKLRGASGEIRALRDVIPDFKYGKERLSRHQIKNLTRIMEKQ